MSEESEDVASENYCLRIVVREEDFDFSQFVTKGNPRNAMRGLPWAAFLLLMASTSTDALIPQVSSVGVRDNQPVQV